jgi:outer membrane biosynthesis protein TonB
LISPLLNLFLLLIIASLAVHSFKALRGWWGYPIAIAGLLAAGLSSLVGPAASFMIDRFGLDSPMPGLHEDLIDVASGLALHILRILFAQARNYALIVLGVGLTIIIVASVLKEPKLKGEKIEDADQESDEIELVPDDGLGGDATEDQEQEETAPPEEAVTEKEKEKEKEKEEEKEEEKKEEENKKEKKKGKRKKKKEKEEEEEEVGELEAESDSDEESSEDTPTEDEH